MNKNIILKSILYGLIGTTILLGMYFGLLTFISGWIFATEQFFQFWYFIISLAVGFGIQVSLFTYLKNVVHKIKDASKIIAVSGTTSVGAMISCCSHYLVNILPIIGITGFASIIGQYQVELFWVGLVSNILGIAYIIRKIIIFKKQI